MKKLKLSSLSFLIFLISTFFLFTGCDKVTIIPERAPLPVHVRNDKPRKPLEVGCIRGYFGDRYMSFKQHIEKVQPVDSFSNCYFYGACPEPFYQINIIRCDSASVFSIYIMGYSVDSLPASQPVSQEFGKYTEMQFSPLPGFNWGAPGNYLLDDFYGRSVLINDITDDIISGTFEGTLSSPNGNIIPVSEGEFRIKIFRKFMKCGNLDGNLKSAATE
jgi:hypothetical protein